MSYLYPPQQMGYTPYKIPQYVQQQNTWMPPSQVRPVTSLEEVKASSIDFDGSIFYFPDVANKVIYTKSINPDGTVALNIYELKNVNADQIVDYSYVTRQEFETTLNDLKTLINTLQQKTENHLSAAQPIVNEYKF